MLSVILVRYGEINLKSRATLRRMIRHLSNNIRIALSRADIAFDKVIHLDSRLVVFSDQAFEGAKIVARRVPGVVSTSHAFLSKSSFEDIKNTLDQVIVSSTFDDVKNFAINVNRVGTHDFSSREMTLWLADQVYHMALLFHHDLEVDLDSPDLRVSIDIRRDNAYLFFDKVSGVGGLPMGTQEDAIGIIRGHYNDYVAASAVMKRGVILKLIVFSEYPAFKQNKEENEKALSLLNLLQPRQPTILFKTESKETEKEWGNYIYETVYDELRKYGARGVALFSSDSREWLSSFPPSLSIYEPLFVLDPDEIIYPFSFFDIKW